MGESAYWEVRETVARTLIEASTILREDQKIAYQRAIEREDNKGAQWVMARFLENGETARETGKPLCNDTGIPHLILEVGESICLDGRLFDEINAGIALGLRRMPGRPMAVKGQGLARVGQNEGLHEDAGLLYPAPIQVRRTDEEKLLITVLMLGGGPEIRGKTYRVFHRHRGMNVIDEVVRWAEGEVAWLGCTPTIPAIGIGRTHYEATCLMLDALRHGNLLEQNDIEVQITNAINRSGVGPLGLGGKTTALGTFLKIGEARAGGTRIVCLRLGCCYDPRRATNEIHL